MGEVEGRAHHVGRPADRQRGGVREAGQSRRTGGRCRCPPGPAARQRDRGVAGHHRSGHAQQRRDHGSGCGARGRGRGAARAGQRDGEAGDRARRLDREARGRDQGDQRQGGKAGRRGIRCPQRRRSLAHRVQRAGTVGPAVPRQQRGGRTTHRPARRGCRQPHPGHRLGKTRAAHIARRQVRPRGTRCCHARLQRRLERLGHQDRTGLSRKDRRPERHPGRAGGRAAPVRVVGRFSTRAGRRGAGHVLQYRGQAARDRADQAVGAGQATGDRGRTPVDRYPASRARRGRPALRAEGQGTGHSPAPAGRPEPGKQSQVERHHVDPDRDQESPRGHERHQREHQVAPAKRRRGRKAGQGHRCWIGQICTRG